MQTLGNMLVFTYITC